MTVHIPDRQQLSRIPSAKGKQSIKAGLRRYGMMFVCYVLPVLVYWTLVEGWSSPERGSDGTPGLPIFSLLVCGAYLVFARYVANHENDIAGNFLAGLKRERAGIAATAAAGVILMPSGWYYVSLPSTFSVASNVSHHIIGLLMLLVGMTFLDLIVLIVLACFIKAFGGVEGSDLEVVRKQQAHGDAAAASLEEIDRVLTVRTPVRPHFAD